MAINFRIKIAGIGGQGVQFIGKLLGDAAFRQGLNVSQGVKYEPSTKGGLTAADITIAPEDEEIVYPFIQDDPDVLLVFAQKAWDEYKEIVGPNTIILADKDNVPNFEVPNCRLALKLPFSEIAREIGAESVMNVVALGFLSELIDIEGHHLTSMLNQSKPEDRQEKILLEVAPDKFKDSLIRLSPKRFQRLNLEATNYPKNSIIAKKHLINQKKKCVKN